MLDAPLNGGVTIPEALCKAGFGKRLRTEIVQRDTRELRLSWQAVST